LFSFWWRIWEWILIDLRISSKKKSGSDTRVYCFFFIEQHKGLSLSFSCSLDRCPNVLSKKLYCLYTSIFSTKLNTILPYLIVSWDLSMHEETQIC
jgi:hypothetical protein